MMQMVSMAILAPAREAIKLIELRNYLRNPNMTKQEAAATKIDLSILSVPELREFSSLAEKAGLKNEIETKKRVMTIFAAAPAVEQAIIAFVQKEYPEEALVFL